MPSFLLFTGKGGVGKTTLSAAAAAKLAEQGKKVLLVSIDPAHSLSDIFEQEIGAEEKEIIPNLYVLELEPGKVLGEGIKNVLEPLKEMLGELPGFEDFLAELTSSPGSDELAALEALQQLLHRQDFDYIIFDTAPTGHTLRFLRLPEMLERRISASIEARKKGSKLQEMLRKFLPFAAPTTEEEEELEKLRQQELQQLQEVLQRIREFRAVLANQQRSRFCLVANPDGLSFHETKKLAAALAALGLPIYKVFINKVLPEQVQDPYLLEWKRLQQRWLEEFRKEFSAEKIEIINLLPYEVKGLEKIKELAANLCI
ncbi:MAG: ArsA family ATPase [bacterium]|nr:ArsA family ATPase [bacterium]